MLNLISFVWVFQTDLDQRHPYTKALKNFGNAALENENGKLLGLVMNFLADEF